MKAKHLALTMLFATLLSGCGEKTISPPAMFCARALSWEEDGFRPPSPIVISGLDEGTRAGDFVITMAFSRALPDGERQAHVAKCNVMNGDGLRLVSWQLDDGPERDSFDMTLEGGMARVLFRSLSSVVIRAPGYVETWVPLDPT